MIRMHDHRRNAAFLLSWNDAPRRRRIRRRDGSPRRREGRRNTSSTSCPRPPSTTRAAPTVWQWGHRRRSRWPADLSWRRRAASRWYLCLRRRRRRIQILQPICQFRFGCRRARARAGRHKRRPRALAGGILGITIGAGGVPLHEHIFHRCHLDVRLLLDALLQYLTFDGVQ